MEVVHLLSSTVLFLVGIYVFFRYLMKLDLIETLLWESFVLSITVAALAAAARFAGIEAALPLTGFFQNLAATAGILGLIVVACYDALGKDPQTGVSYATLAIGFILFGLQQTGVWPQVTTYVPLLAIPFLAIAGFLALGRKRLKKLGMYLLIAVLFMSLAMFRSYFIADEDQAVDVYNLLMAAAVLFFGLAASRRL